MIEILREIAPWVALFVTLIAMFSENRRSRFVHGLDMTMTFAEKFFSISFQKIRRTAADFLLKNGDDFYVKNAFTPEIEQILDFFEAIAYLCRKKVLDKEILWIYFYNWLDRYFTILTPYIQSTRTVHPSAWDDVDWLHNQLSNFGGSTIPGVPGSPESKRTIQEFLIAEQALA